MAAESAFIKLSTSGAIQLRDGTGTPVTLTLSYDKGDGSLGPLADKLNESVKIERRGRFVSHGYGARIYPQVSFSAWCGNLVGSSASAPGTPTEFAAKLGAYSANTGTLGAGRPYTIDIRWTVEGTDPGDTADETITAEDVRCQITWNEAMDGNSIAISGEVLGNVVVVNSSNTVTFAQIT